LQGLFCVKTFNVLTVRCDFFVFLTTMNVATIWLTGLSGAGKSTLAKGLTGRLTDQRHRVFILDGDTLRSGLCKDLDFSQAGRAENIRRTAEVARILNDAGITVVAALISPLEVQREVARSIIGSSRFVEVFVSADLRTCETRDCKGLYAAARAGDLQNFTGIGSQYETPAAPELVVDTVTLSPPAALDRLTTYVMARLIDERQTAPH
jgi:adenylylsulfate kinase